MVQYISQYDYVIIIIIAYVIIASVKTLSKKSLLSCTVEFIQKGIVIAGYFDVFTHLTA